MKVINSYTFLHANDSLKSQVHVTQEIDNTVKGWHRKVHQISNVILNSYIAT